MFFVGVVWSGYFILLKMLSVCNFYIIYLIFWYVKFFFKYDIELYKIYFVIKIISSR